jgi:hypothetical protein
MVDERTSCGTFSDDLAGAVAVSPRTGWSAAIAVVAVLAIVGWLLTEDATAPSSAGSRGTAIQNEWLIGN